MDNSIAIPNIASELPSRVAERLGLAYASSVSSQHKKENGQFFTPIGIAEFMASCSDYRSSKARVLDPGCGTAVLSCAWVERMVLAGTLRQVELTAYETDTDLTPYTRQSLDYLEKWCAERSVRISTTLYTDDFVMRNADALESAPGLFSPQPELFDVVLSNPPYFKLPIDDKRAVAAKIIVNGHPNIYAIFMAMSAKLLQEEGELIFITPRSYAAGSYFKTFREFFFRLVDLERAHLFVSRKETFSRDKVLQETVIIKAVKRNTPGPEVVISSSCGVKDLAYPSVKVFPKKDIIDIDSKEKILYLPVSDKEEAILEVFKYWTGSLSKYHIRISTGPVVAFRAVQHISEAAELETVRQAPLFWLHNVRPMQLEWPVTKPNKGQYIHIEGVPASLLIPNKNYVLLRRFSSKDDKSRLVAAPCFAHDVQSDWIGVENKVNYIYRAEGELEANEVMGFCALLNSRLFDAYFRIFNGNVNVSATELREMPLPPISMIRAIGDALLQSDDVSAEHADRIVTHYLEPAEYSL